MLRAFGSESGLMHKARKEILHTPKKFILLVLPTWRRLTLYCVHLWMSSSETGEGDDTIAKH